MKRNTGGLLSDGGFLLFIILCFIAILFMPGGSGRDFQSMVLLNVAFLIAILTYFTNVTAGLILNILFIFAYGTYTLYQSVVAVGNPVGAQTYFWLLMTPLFTGAIWMFSYGVQRIQRENETLRTANTQLATVDQNTNLKNSLSFQNDATVFMALSNRYDIPLTLLVVQVRYWNEVRRMISDNQMTDVLYEMSQLGQTSIRTNDSLYMLDQETATWGLLLFTDSDGANIVINRLKENVAHFNEDEKTNDFKVEFQLRIGKFEYSADTVQSPLEFIDKARKQLEFDV
ncbi:diguanylate cyclase domain-containing protein [Paenibacillus sp. GCM10027627]|uniref:diguanylate cyclase domain-containing protein n=1 Tax=unclassified Paenibacillus TaxID=185978 RepID=UPI003638C8E4